MKSANLNKATLTIADLNSANLSGANLSGADLTGAKGVTDYQLNEAKSLHGAIMPDGTKHP